MKTIISFINPNNIDLSVIEQAASIIQNGGIVAFPTETVYGLGGDALNPESSAKIYEAKGRPSDNPLIVHIADIDKLPSIVSDIPEEAGALADRFWPGPLTIIFNKSDIVPYKTTGGLNTVAVRYPSDPVAQAFIRASGGYIAAPSANLSGKPSPTVGKYVIQDLDGRVDMIITGDDSVIGLESTIVDLTSDVPMILRPGYITYEALKEVIPNVCMDPALIHTDDPSCHIDGASNPSVKESCHPEHTEASCGITDPACHPDGASNPSVKESCHPEQVELSCGVTEQKGQTEVASGDSAGTLLHPKAPGMKYRHYAPNGSLVIVCRSHSGSHGTSFHEKSGEKDFSTPDTGFYKESWEENISTSVGFGNILKVDESYSSSQESDHDEMVDESCSSSQESDHDEMVDESCSSSRESGHDEIVSYINERLARDHASGLKTAVITTDERINRYNADVICSTGPEDDPGEAAHRLFAILRKMDDEGVQSIYAEGMSESGIGVAYMNRLRKAAGGKIVYI